MTAAASEPPSTLPERRTPSPFTLGLLVFLSAMALYLPSFQNELLTLDDSQYVTRNPYVLYPTWAKVGRVFSETYLPSTVLGYYQPLTMASLMLDRAVEGRLSGGYSHEVDPFVYHFTNILLHGLNASLVFLVLYLFTRSGLIAVIGGLLFAAHPLNVEVVAWVSQRKALLATFFALIMILTHERAARTGRTAWHAATCLAFLASVLSKPTGIFLPLVLLLLDIWPLRRFSRNAIVEKVPLMVIAVITGWIAYKSQTSTVDLSGTEGHRPLSVTLLVAAHNLVFYIAKFVVPIRLCPIYVMPDEAGVLLRSPPFLAGAIGTITLSAIAIWAILKRRLPIWTMLAAFLLLIGSTLTPVRFMGAIAADRFAYTPMIALIILLAEGLRAWHVSYADPATANRRLRLTAAASAIIVALFAVQTIRQQAVWQNSRTHYGAVLARFPDAPESHYGMGNAYLSEYHKLAAKEDDASAAKAEEYLNQAVDAYRAALDVDPDYSNAYYRLGHVLILRGHVQEGINLIQQGLMLPAYDPDGFLFLGLAYTHIGDYEKAIEPYKICLERQPSWTEVRKNLANALLRTGRAGDSLEHYERLYELNPTDLDGIQNWSVALLTVGRLDEAIEKLREVVRIREMLFVKGSASPPAASPLAGNGETPTVDDDKDAASLADAQFTLAGALAFKGASGEALSHLDAAVSLKPDLLDQAERHPAFADLTDTPGWRMLVEKHQPTPSK